MGDNTIKELKNKDDAKDKKYISDFIGLISFALILGLFLLIFPFVFPIISNILINFNIIQDIEQLKECINIFKYFYILIIVGIVTLFWNEGNISISQPIKELINNMAWDLQKGDMHVKVTHNNPFNDSVKNETKRISNELKEEAKSLLLSNDKSKAKSHLCSNCKEEIEAERESLRYFSAYQVTDEYIRDLLFSMKDNSKLSIREFKYTIEQYYQKKFHYHNKTKKQKIILQKIDTLLYNLKYINIIEYTEDNNAIILTQNGREFVNGLYESEVG